MSNYRRDWRALKIDSLKNLGKQNFRDLKNLKEKNNSPSPNVKKTNAELLAKLAACQKVLKIHKENNNRVMIGYTTAEIKDLEKKLK